MITNILITQHELRALLEEVLDQFTFKLVQDLKQQNKTLEPDNLLSIKEVSLRIGVSLPTVHKYKKKGIIKGWRRLGGRVFLPESQLNQIGKEIIIRKGGSKS